MADDSTAFRLLDKAAEAILEPFRQAVKVVYIDSDFLFDYRLGALLLKTTSEDQYKYILEHLSEYEKGSSRNITKYFPDLKITEKDLDDLNNDQDYVHAIVYSSPRTVFHEELQGFVASVNTFNQGKNTDQPLKLVINQRKFLLPEKVKQAIENYIHSVDSTVIVSFVHFKDWTEVTDKEFMSYDMLLVNDLSDFVKSGTTSQRFMANNDCDTKIVIAPVQADKEFETKEDEEIALENTSRALNMVLCKFQFVSKALAIER